MFFEKPLNCLNLKAFIALTLAINGSAVVHAADCLELLRQLDSETKIAPEIEPTVRRRYPPRDPEFYLPFRVFWKGQQYDFVPKMPEFRLESCSRAEFEEAEVALAGSSQGSQARGLQILSMQLGLNFTRLLSKKGAFKLVVVSESDPGWVYKIYRRKGRDRDADVQQWIRRELAVYDILRRLGFPVAEIDLDPRWLSKGVIRQKAFQGIEIWKLGKKAAAKIPLSPEIKELNPTVLQWLRVNGFIDILMMYEVNFLFSDEREIGIDALQGRNVMAVARGENDHCPPYILFDW